MSLVAYGISSDKRYKYVTYKCTTCGYIGKMRKDHYLGEIGCSVCSGKTVMPGFNDLATVRPDLVQFLADELDATKVTAHSAKKVDVQCPTCGFKKRQAVSDLTDRGFRCAVCYGGHSMPNRFMSALLVSLNINFTPEMMFPWSEKFRYDFYIPSVNTIIEMHGRQHYVDRVGWSSLERNQKNDKIKRDRAIENGVQYYIEIPADRSHEDYLRDNIIRSGLFDILGTENADIDWANVFSLASTGAPKRCLDLWNDRLKNTNKIAEIVKVSSCSVVAYLSEYASKGLCDYSAKEQQKIGNHFASESRKTPVVCINTGQEFDSIREAARRMGISEKALQNHLRGKSKSSGKDKNGNKLIWNYLRSDDLSVSDKMHGAGSGKYSQSVTP